MRRPNEFLQDRFVVALDHASATQDTTLPIMVVDRDAVVEKVEYVNPTGLAQDASNFFEISLINDDDDAIAVWSTETGVDGTLTANEWVSLTVDSALGYLAAGDGLRLFLDETGTATLPAGRMLVHIRYL